MRRLLFTIVSGACIAALILYAADYACIRFGRSPFGAVIVTRYYLIPKKNGKTEFVFKSRRLQTAANGE